MTMPEAGDILLKLANSEPSEHVNIINDALEEAYAAGSGCPRMTWTA